MNLLTTVLNASPVLPTDVEDGDLETLEMVRDNPQCVAFGLFMIWFSSITINLGPTFLSGALAANADDHINEPSCPLVQVRNFSFLHTGFTFLTYIVLRAPIVTIF